MRGWWTNSRNCAQLLSLVLLLTEETKPQQLSQHCSCVREKQDCTRKPRAVTGPRELSPSRSRVKWGSLLSPSGRAGAEQSHSLPGCTPPLHCTARRAWPSPSPWPPPWSAQRKRCPHSCAWPGTCPGWEEHLYHPSLLLLPREGKKPEEG